MVKIATLCYKQLTPVFIDSDHRFYRHAQEAASQSRLLCTSLPLGSGATHQYFLYECAPHICLDLRIAVTQCRSPYMEMACPGPSGGQSTKMSSWPCCPLANQLHKNLHLQGGLSPCQTRKDLPNMVIRLSLPFKDMSMSALTIY